MTNETYVVVVYEITKEKANEIIKAFADRDIKIDIDENDDICNMTIRNIHKVTMTPFMIWFLHHVDNGDYYKLTIF